MTPVPAGERVDVVDDRGRTVDTVTRREMRERRLPHRCCYILVFNRRGELFVHLRTSTKDVYPSHWDVAVGGVVASGETFAQSAMREVEEEIGVTVPLEALFPIRFEDDHTIVHGVVYEAMHDGPFRLQASEVVRGEFVPPGEVWARARSEPFTPDGLAVLDRHRRWRGTF